MSPIDINIFKQLIPVSYKQNISEQLMKICEIQENESKSKTASVNQSP